LLFDIKLNVMAGQDLLDPILDLGMLETAPAWKLSSRFLVCTTSF